MIKIKYLPAAVALLVAVSCKKDNNGGISLNLSSYSNTVVPVLEGTEVGESLTFDFTDNGSVVDTLGMIKVRLNQVPTATIRDTLYYNVPSYPKTYKGQFQVAITYNDLISASQPPTSGNPPQDDSDSLIFRFFAKDQANRTSDTVSTGLIVIQRQN